MNDAALLAVLRSMEERVGHAFADQELLREALTHPSMRDTAPLSYERMEFLGDAVLGLVTAQYLYQRFPESDEGELTRIKSAVVSRTSMAEIGKELEVDRHLILSKGMIQQGPLPSSVVANAMEALIAAVYLDGGMEPARRLILGQIASRIDRVVRRRRSHNYKSMLQQLTQRLDSTVPTYKVLSVSGPDHERQFTICACLGSREFPPASGSSKKVAEQRAARLALRILESEPNERSPAPAP